MFMYIWNYPLQWYLHVVALYVSESLQKKKFQQMVPSHFLLYRSRVRRLRLHRTE